MMEKYCCINTTITAQVRLDYIKEDLTIVINCNYSKI